jgi:hypothetical protein
MSILQADTLRNPDGTKPDDIGIYGSTAGAGIYNSVRTAARKQRVRFSGTTNTVVGSNNTSSVTDLGVGAYKVNLTAANQSRRAAFTHSYSNEVNVQHALGFLWGTVTASEHSYAHFNAANSGQTTEKSVFCATRGGLLA